MKIITERLILRDFVTEDKAGFTASRSLETDLYHSEEDLEKKKSDQLVDLFMQWSEEQERRGYQLAIIEKSSGEFIGTTGIRITSEIDREASFGSSLSYRYRCKGYALEASNALLDFAFEKLDLHRVVAETVTENAQAIELAKKLGMLVEGELRENRFFRGRWWNTVLLAVLKSEWLSNRSY